MNDPREPRRGSAESPETRRLPQGAPPLLLVPRILWGALLTSTAAFAGMLFVVEAPPAPATSLLVPLAAVALVVAGMSFVLPAQTGKANLLRLELRVEEVPIAARSAFPEEAARGGGGYRDLAPTERRFADKETARRRIFAVAQTSLILSLALSEAVGLFGLALRVIGHPIASCLPFVFAACVLMLLRFPTEASMFGPAERAYRAKL